MDLAMGQQLKQNFATGGADLQQAISKIDSAVSQSESFWKGPGGKVPL